MISTEIIGVDVGGRTFQIKAVKDIDSLLNLVQSDDDVPFWAVLWPAAIGMARYVWREADLSGKRVLELGAGLGLAGIVAAARGGIVRQTDYVPEALEYCALNSELNSIHTIERMLADWRQFQLTDGFDVIIGSDILYEPSLHPYLKDIFLHYLNPGGRVILADPGRSDADNFISDMKKAGFKGSTKEFIVEDKGLKYKVKVHLLERGSQ